MEKTNEAHLAPSLNELIEKSIRDNWELTALSDMGGVNLPFKDVAVYIEKLHILFEAAGLKPGDKVAICGKNSSKWAVALIACLTARMVAVPILHEFKPDMVHHLVNHSDARLLFVDAAIWENLDERLLPNLEGAIYISEFGMPFSRNKELTEARNNINELFGKKFPYDFMPESVRYDRDAPGELALINYTSGSTGASKGVMLPFRSLWSNVRFCLDHLPFLKAGDGIVNMLPLAHLYGMTIDMLHPFCKGCHCHFLTRVPSPKIILKAFAEVKPKLIITVPLILDKIIRTRVFPLLDKPLMKILMHIPLVDDHLLDKIKERLMTTFGGNLHEMIIGGAPLNGDVEAFLRRIRFPFTVGYGMTECAPLITYSPWDKQRPGSCGQLAVRMEARIDSPDPANKPGVLYVRGANVMKGYYKNPEATAQALDKDGWLNTGDICSMDEDGYLTIRGRDKSMILGPSGQNIYPEEIEQKLNSMLYVAESIVIDDNNKLVALIYPDFDTAHKAGLDDRQIEEQMNRNIEQLNDELPAYSRVSRMRMLNEEFEKTPKRSIKRYLYQH